jgi:RNA polymerase sigma-70 factor (ECF subfamily)
MQGPEPPRLSLAQEQALVQRLQQGDSSALEPLWRAYAGILFRAVIYPSLPIRDLAEEVLQNTFLKAFERIQGFTWQERGVLPWLKTIARNLAMDAHRRHQRADRFCQGYGQHLDALADAHGDTSRPDKALADKQEEEMARARVRAVLDSGKLNERYHAAIDLRLFQELDRDACAQRLDVRVGTFDVLFHRALKRFEQIYQEMYGGAGSAGGRQ